MIEGLHLDIKSSELNKILVKRIKYHEAKVEYYRKKVNEGIEEQLDLDEEVSGNPLPGYKRKVKEHKDKVGFFRFISDHLIPDETYRLTMRDLSTLEVTEQYFLF
ncbi:MAG: hypothetical protein ACYTFW_00545 [Planctomycetota bacterium]